MLEKFKAWKEKQPLFSNDMNFFKEEYALQFPTEFHKDFLLEFVRMSIAIQKLSDRIEELED